ncbi:2-dehydropantoate 2-reductase [Fulvivirgaceae bacterium BMA12]|uniref:2-dehydropantoate 2-reductase n=1 Tax=Agaribacillus aureus TaxID=3051825 RepID=A0ABT8LAW4_9BACT|nr:2-dehydropantoate 2-reductase [Fulvivirgaceae bacterium BMA12]
MKILIYGTGGVGGYFGGKLAQAGNDVTFIARGEHLNAMKRQGLKVLSPKGDFTVSNPKATDDVSGLEAMDLILLGVKSFQVKEAVSAIKNLIKSETIIIPLQNGVFANEEIMEIVGKTNLVGGLCKIISRIESPGVINHMMYEPSIAIGELDHEVSDRAARIQSLFQQSGIQLTVTDNIQAALWKKFMFICTGGLGALTRFPYGVNREMTGTRDLLLALIAEIYTVGKQLGIALQDHDKDNAMKIVDSLPHEATSSMQRDIIEGRPSELEYLTGAVVKLGKTNGVDTPVNSFIYHCLLPAEHKNRGIL